MKGVLFLISCPLFFYSPFVGICGPWTVSAVHMLSDHNGSELDVNIEYEEGSGGGGRDGLKNKTKQIVGC